MTTRRTVFETISDGAQGASPAAALTLGAFGLVAGILAIDHYYSKKEHRLSAVERLEDWMSLTTTPRMEQKWHHSYGAHDAHPHKTGAAAPGFALLPPFAQQVIDHALSESDPKTLAQLSKNLRAAGMPALAAEVQAKAKGA